MYYVLRNNQIKQNCMEHLSGLPDEPLFQVEVKLFKKGRSNQQNKYYWGVVLKIFGDFMGETPDDLHAFFKHRLLADKDRVIMGEKIPGSASTTELTTKEFMEYIDMIRATAATMDCEIPPPNTVGVEL